MKIGPVVQFIVIGIVVGTLLPTMLTLCLFGTTVGSFVANPAPTQGYWSGAATPAPTPVPSPARVWTRSVFSAARGAVFLLWSVLGALGGEALAIRRGEEWNAIRNAWLGAAAGSVIFVAIAVCGFLQ